MPSIITHALAGGALAYTGAPGRWKVIALAGLSAMVPDADALGYFAGVPYSSLFEHRGITHSLFFALLWAAIITALFFRKERSPLAMLAVLFLATASHPLLDMLTNGGLGCALFAPFSNERFFFPWRPIEVAPIGVGAFFSSRGMQVLISEMKTVWLPALVVIGALTLMRRIKQTT